MRRGPPSNRSYRREYNLINALNGAVTELFNTGKNASPLALDMQNELLLGRDSGRHPSRSHPTNPKPLLHPRHSGLTGVCCDYFYS